MFETGTASNYLDLLDRLDIFLTAGGSAFGLTYVGTGNGTISGLKGGASSVAETFTLTATSASSFNVVGSVSGSIGPATVGTPFSHAKLGFLITAGGTAFTAGDAFTLSTAPKWTNLRRSMGSTVLATQGNAGINAAQNLVDGKDESSLQYWRVDTPVTLPQDVQFTLHEAATVASYELAGFYLLAAYGPKSWTFDYWNGSAWVTLDTQSNISSWTELGVMTFPIGSPVSATLYRLHITAINFASALVLGAARLLRSTGVDVAFGQFIWQAPGNDGDSQIFVGARPFERIDADYFDWELAGFDGFNASAKWRRQAGWQGHLYLPLWNSSIPYWFIADGRRAIIIAKIDAQYEMAYLGFADPYFSPGQWPYPLILGGTLAFDEAYPAWNSTTFRWSNSTNNHRMPTHSDIRGQGSPTAGYAHLRARNLNGIWLPLVATQNDFYTTTPTSTEHIIWPYRCGLTLLDANRDGSYGLWPVILNLSAPNTLGQLRGVACVTGQGLTSETLIRLGSIDWLALPNINRTDREDYLAAALD